jgi:RNA polymerase sigma-70 factor (sigma-E family)
MRDPDGAIEREFAGYVVARQHRLLRAAYLVCGDEHLAEDLLQQAFAKLAVRWERIRNGNPDAYMQRILYRDAVSWWRRVRRERLGAEVPDLESDHDEQADSDVRIDIRRALRQLTPKQRAVLVLRFFEDLTELETADLLGVSVGTVKSQTHVALNRLRNVGAALADERRAADQVQQTGRPKEWP